MGIDVEIHFSTKEKLDKEQFDRLNGQLAGLSASTDCLLIKYQEHQSFGRLYNYEPDRKHIYSLWTPFRYYPDAHQRGNWPKIYFYIKFLQNNAWVETVYYGGDSSGILREVCQKEMEKNWIAYGGDRDEELLKIKEK